MADRYPKPYDELVAENARLRADVERLERSLGNMQAVSIAQDAELSRLTKPKRAPRVLDPAATDAFLRPARLR